jgi:hypothetical protein
VASRYGADHLRVGEHDVAVDERRDLAARVHREQPFPIGLLLDLMLRDVEVLLVDRRADLERERAERVVVQIHGP